MPFNQKFYQEYQKKPDLYGPFWILQTLVVVLTISGNLSRYLELPDKEKPKFEYNFNIVPIAMSVLFGIALGLPFAIRMVVNCFGDKESTVPLLHGVGIYSYSFSSFLLSSLLCGMIPVVWLQWILIIYSALTSIIFLIGTYWADLSTTLNAKKRMAVVAGIVLTQISLLLIFKLYFFEHVSYNHPDD